MCRYNARVFSPYRLNVEHAKAEIWWYAFWYDLQNRVHFHEEWASMIGARVGGSGALGEFKCGIFGVQCFTRFVRYLE